MQPHEGVLQVLTLNFSDLTHSGRRVSHCDSLQHFAHLDARLRLYL